MIRGLCRIARGVCLWGPLVATSPALGSEAFGEFARPLFSTHCTKCHAGKRAKGGVDLKAVTTREQLLAQPELIRKVIQVIDAADMPPEDEPAPSEADRTRLIATLKSLLRVATAAEPERRAPIRRLNRFQYNNAVKDLFRMKVDVFRLPEKLMTRYGYLNGATGKMPDRVEVACRSLEAGGGLRGVSAFPKDLRAAHGFDNQANQLNLSPLLLDAFLRLSVSIVESPDFNPQTVGIWSEFFAAPPANSDLGAEVTSRLWPFLRLAFRRPVEDATLDRYAAFALAKVREGLSFTDSMKRVSSAVLSSPLFLYRGTGDLEARIGLASSLSFFLWGSGPDLELLRLAETGELSQPDVLLPTLERMLDDPRIERFLDTFPAQWMQLENVLAATPDPRKHRLFSLEKTRPASLQMVLEPLLLFDAIFLENRSVVELLSPSFSYQSEFLKTWYGTDLKPPPLDEPKVAAENRQREESLRALEVARDTIRGERKELDAALLERSLAVVDASAQTQWEISQSETLEESFGFSLWHRIGPFTAPNFEVAHEKSFLDESKVDLTRTYGRLEWMEAASFVDGKVHQLNGSNCATYLLRTIEAGAARPLTVSLGSDDSFRLWLNGRLVADKKISRGVAPDQDRLTLELREGKNTLLLKIANGGGGYGFYFKAEPTTLPSAVVAALRVPAAQRTREHKDVLRRYYITVAPELAALRAEHAEKVAAWNRKVNAAEEALKRAPRPQSLEKLRQDAQRRFDERIRTLGRSRTFDRVDLTDPRYGGVITNAAMLSMTSGPKRTHPIARGAWMIEVIFNDPPPPPPNDVPPLNEDSADENLTIREQFAVHRENPDCAGCHARLDPLGFALENYDSTGRWRDVYDNGRRVDSSGTLLRKYNFAGIVQFKESLLREKRRFAKAFTAHLLRFALSRELGPGDTLTVEEIVDKTAKEDFRLRSILREVVVSDSFVKSN